MKTLLLIDVQNDFMPGGSLAVRDGQAIVPIINRIQPYFEHVIASQDWHPPEHLSFARNHPGRQVFEEIELNGLPQTLWPAHCVQNSKGAQLHADLNTAQIAAIFRKGTDPEIDSYSTFYDNGRRKSTGLTGYLKELSAKTLYFCGLAADFCVYFSIQDALLAGFDCVLIEDATRAIDDDNYQNLRNKLHADGVKLMTSEALLN